MNWNLGVKALVLSKRKTGTATKKRTLISYTHPDSFIAEQFRMIQMNIKFLMAEKKGQIFLITSPGTGEGKSTVAANSAVSMAQQKEKILLIDANLRTPIQHVLFKLPNSIGLAEVLRGKESFKEAVHHTEIGRLDVLTGGNPPMNSGELLGSAMMQELLDTALQSYDIVLIDSFAVNDVTDTKLLAKKCDGVILVFQNGKTSMEKAYEAKKDLEFSKAKLMGVILNEM